MGPPSVGSPAPPIPGIDLRAGVRALFFYKVTCPVCRLAAPVAQRMAAAYPGAISGIGQDPGQALDRFAGSYEWSFGSTADLPPHPVSDAYGIRVVPTVVVVRDGRVADVVESWDRDGYVRLSSLLAEATGRPFASVSEEGDGLPSFRPG
jgi:thiol-disulfide isomerase/thioredoxin